MRKRTMRKPAMPTPQMRRPTALRPVAVLGAFSLMLASLTLASLAILAGATPARAETWCLRDFSGGAPLCVFPSARQCVAGSGAFGGVCERQSDVERAAAPYGKGPGAKNARKRGSDGSPGGSDARRL